MAIKYESDLKWGDKFYLKSDPEQLEYNLISIILAPGKPQYFLRHSGYDEVTVYECETTRKPDIKKTLNITKEDTPDDSDDE